MPGEMVFAQINLNDMRRVSRRLENEELGLFMRIVEENCLMQAPLEVDRPELPRLLSCKTRKTFDRLLEALIEKGVVTTTNGAVMATMADKAIKHFQTNSENAKRAVASRKDRQHGGSAIDEPQHETVATPGSGSIPADLSSTHWRNERDKPDGSDGLSFDRTVQDLKDHAQRLGHLNLAEALCKEDAQRRVEAWCELGLSHEQIVEKAIEVMKNKSGERISSWKYFDRAMRALSDAAAGQNCTPSLGRPTHGFH